MIGRFPFSTQPSQAGAILKWLRHSTVAWSWVANGLRVAIGVFLLPLVLHKLSTEELGMYYVLLSLVALAPVIDFGFSPTIVRFVSYAMGGAETIQPQGFARATTASPNRQLLSQLFFTTRSLYRYMAVVALVLVGAWGTYMVELRVHETPFPTVTRVAWAITLVATVFDIYSNWAVIFLRGMNEVLVSVQISVLASVVKFVVAAGLLLGGGGLMSLPLGSLVGSRVAGSGAHLAKPADTLAQQLAPGADDVEHLPDQPGQHCHLPEGAGAGGKCPIRAFGPTGWHHQRHGGCLDHGQMAAYRPVSRAARLRHHAPGVVATVLVATPELSGSGRRVDSLWAAVAAVVWQRQTDAAPGLACPVGAVLLC